MSAKKQVLNLYPDAWVKVLTNDRPNKKPTHIYLVKVNKEPSPNSPFRGMPEREYTIGVGVTETLAFDMAWHKIQLEMLKKLES
jgi:hypothetical protein